MESDYTSHGDKPLLFIAINETSGSDIADLPDTISKKLCAAGHGIIMVKIPKGGSIPDSCTDLVKDAVKENGIVVAAGGDGTINAIASICYEHGAVMGVIPLGTFNYFARALGIPTKLDDALKLLGNGTVRKVSAGFVKDRLFLNNATFGLYSELIRRREEATKHFGRRRFIAFISGLDSLFRKQKIFTIQLNVNGKTESYRTSMVFVGNNSLQLENFGLKASEYAKENKLAIIILKPTSRLGIAKMIWRGVAMDINAEPKLQQFSADSFEVKSNRSNIHMVIDGEIIKCATPLDFRVEKDCISVIVPATDTEKE